MESELLSRDKDIKGTTKDLTKKLERLYDSIGRSRLNLADVIDSAIVYNGRVTFFDKNDLVVASTTLEMLDSVDEEKD